MKRRKSIWERYENHAIYDTKSPRKKRQPQPTESQVTTFSYLEGLRQSVANRVRFTR
ncbi:NinE family protein [Pantoea sp. GbtcB22]|jgi:hypothetical protein|uniref:NinE family protein n=1 Tax=Pantoea sp. GbtcB22 TaxID=2824767 RepID=UPI000A652345|nr:NinE family protein [Pantoea sp. GbtcB22]